MHSESLSTDIAIIGMSALFPGAKNLSAYWQNILNKVDAVREAPEKWIGPYFDPNSTENDRLYTRKGGFLGDLAEFNPMEFGIMPNSIDGGDPDHFLALKLARDALRDAGYLDRPFNPETTGIILGRGTYFNRGFGTVIQHGMIVDQTLTLLQQINPELDQDTLSKIRKELKASLPPFTAEMSPGLVPNVVTGRIANRLNLMGPNYIVDAACSSSLISVELAIKEILSGRCDMMLAGGIQASTPPQVHMVFCQLGALSHSDIRPFNHSADGTLLSEGGGILVLKRLSSAQRDGDRIYAVLKGVGISSDGKALGLLAPRLEGEVLALQRAYQENNLDPNTVSLIEAHGTGIPLGDQTEVKSLTHVFGQRRGQMPGCALGSVKSMIGHCIPAAGAASLIKMALALYHKILPPTLCDQVNPALEIEKTPFYINSEARPWIHSHWRSPRRAGVNAFGFGGINAHVVLEEYPEQPASEVKLLHQQWPTELLVFSASDRAGLMALIEQVQQLLIAQPDLSLAQLAWTLSIRALGTHRLAIIAQDVADLHTKLNLVVEKLKDPHRTRLQVRSGIYYAAEPAAVASGKVAFLFPGEGSQYANMLSDLCLHLPKVRAWFDLLDEAYAETREHPPSSFIFPPPTGLTDAERQQAAQELFMMDIASETVFISSMALNELLSDLGIQCDGMVGHSTGEYAAMRASGTVPYVSKAQIKQSMRHLNRIYCEIESGGNIPKGALLAVGAVHSGLLQELLDQFAGRLYIAMDNCPNQVVLCGNEDDIAVVAERLKAAGAIYNLLPFDRPYHTPLFKDVETAFQAFYAALDVAPGHTSLYSCATGDAFPTEAHAIRDLAAKQWSSPVRFRETIERLYEEGFRIFVEVGPSGNLTAFVNDILQGRDFLALPSNSQRKSSLEQIQHLLALLLSSGKAVDLTPLYQHRELQPMSLDAATTHDRAKQKTDLILDLTMPVIQLRAETVHAIQESLQAGTSLITKSDQTDSMSHKGAQSSFGFKAVAEAHPSGNGAAAETLPSFSTAQPEVVVSTLPNLVEAEPLDSASLFSTTPAEPQTLREEPPLGSPIEELVVFNGYQPTAEPCSSNEAAERSFSSPGTLMAAHFELMQEFLASQARIATALYASPNNNTYQAAWPLLGQVIGRDSQSLQWERRFDLDQDIFLADHALGGSLSQLHPELSSLSVIPFAVSMEILAEAATCLVGGNRVVLEINEVRGYRWLALDHGQLALTIQAQVQPTPDQSIRVQVQIFQSDPTTAHPHLVFEGYVRLGEEFLPVPSPLNFHLEQATASRWADTDLYTKGMFHGPRFQGVRHIRQWSQQGIEADVEVLPIENFFAQFPQPVFQIDPGLLDTAMQLVAFWVSEQLGTDFHVFPFQVHAFYQYVPNLEPGARLLCRGLVQFVDEKRTTIANFDFLDQQGQLIARVVGLQSLYFDVPHEYYQCRLHPQESFFSKPWMQSETSLICRRIERLQEGFLEVSGGICKRALAHLMLNSAERTFWYGLAEKGPRRTEWLLGRIAAKDALRQWAEQAYNLKLAPVDITILSTETGKPRVTCPELAALGPLPDVSISHSRGYVVAALAQPGKAIGIDIERIDSVHSPDLLSAAFSPSEQQLLSQQTIGDAAIVGFWCAKEAAAKAVGSGLQGVPMQWPITNYLKDSQRVTISRSDLSLDVQLWYYGQEVLAICQY